MFLSLRVIVKLESVHSSKFENDGKLCNLWYRPIKFPFRNAFSLLSRGERNVIYKWAGIVCIHGRDAWIQYLTANISAVIMMEKILSISSLYLIVLYS